MGWNPIRDITNTASNVVKQATQIVAPVTNAINRGDPGKFVGGLVTSARDVTLASGIVASDLARGDIKQASRSTLRGVGAGMNVSSFGAAKFTGEDRTVQSFLRSKQVSNLTLGLSNDWAGYNHGISTANSSGDFSNADRDSTLRLYSKAAVIAGGAAAYSAYKAPIAAAAESGKSLAIYGGAAKSLAAGDIKGAAGQLTGTPLGDAVGGFLPQLPNLPSWVPDLSSIYDAIIPKSAPSSSVNQSGASVASAPLIQSNTGKTLAVASVMAGCFFLIKKQGLLK